MFAYEIDAKPFDKLRRFIFGASVRLPNIDQCPRCRGTDRTCELYEGFRIAKFRCERCSTEWWS